MSSNNIVLFPKGKKDSPPLSMEQLMSSVSDTRTQHADFILDEIGSFIFARSFEEGFDLGGDDNEKQVTLMMESIRSCLLHVVGVDHVLQEFAEDCIQLNDEEELI